MAFSKQWRAGLLLAWVSLGPAVGLTAPPLPPTEEVLERMIQRGVEVRRQFEEQQLSYSKRSVLEKLNRDGKVNDREEKLYEVFFKNGRVRMNLIELNGEETSTAQKEADNGVVKPEDAGDMKPPKGEERPLVLTEKLVERYHFEIVEMAASAGRECFVLKFEAKPGLKENGLTDRFMNRLGGKIWVDHQDYEIVRAELGLRSPVRILGGLIGAVNRFDYTVERTPVGAGVWLNRASRSDFELRKLLISSHYRTKSEWQSVLME